MAPGRDRAILPEIQRAFQTGTVAALSDGDLLERFVARSDELAFEALVARHGPMVLRVCRHLLRDDSKVEDAFQATFLVLVRKAGSIALRDSLGPWLYAVATRVASRAQANEAKRHRREQAAVELSVSCTSPDPDLHELPAILQRELACLPEHLRAPIVLFHLEGLTHDQTAHQLHWPVGTVRSRLARGRGLLRERLARRGFPCALGMLGAALSDRSSTAAVTRRLSLATIEAAARLSARSTTTAGIVSASVSSLTEGVLFTMFTSKLKVAAGIILAAGLLASSVAVRGDQDPAQDHSNHTPNKVKAEPSQTDRDHRIAQEIENILNSPITLNYENRPLSEAINLLANETGINLVLDPKALADADVTTATPVTLQVKGVKFKSALKLLLRPIGLNYKVEDEVIMITSPPSMASQTYPKAYYVGDLILPPGFPLPGSNEKSPTHDSGRTDGQNGQSNRPRVNMKPLISLITTTIAPGTWQVVDPAANTDNSAGYGIGVEAVKPKGSITPFFLNISLIIRATPEVHKQLETFLGQLRQLQTNRDQLMPSSLAVSPSPIENSGNQKPDPGNPPAAPTLDAATDQRYDRIEELLKKMGQQFTDVTRELDQLKNERMKQGSQSPPLGSGASAPPQIKLQYNHTTQ